MSSSPEFLPMLWHYCFSTLAFVVPLAGIGLNFFVLCKLRKIARLNLFRFETSSALPLAAMSVCDSICLLALFAQAVFHVVLKLHSKDIAANDVAVADSGGTSSIEQHGASMFCKIDLYLLHTTSAFSVWCWLVLSILRYTAVFHPFRYRLIWRQPRHALGLLASASGLLELWIPFTVTYDSRYSSCSESETVSADTIQTAHVLDILLSYVVPAFLRIVLDGVVLCHCYRPNVLEVPVVERRFGISAPSGLVPRSSDEFSEKSPMTIILNLSRQPITYKRLQVGKKRNEMLRRSLFISALNLLCNLPSHALRALWSLDGGEQVIPERWMMFFEGVSQLLYFGQFTCNAFYLSTTIYETSTVPMRPYTINSSAPGTATTTNGGNTFRSLISDDV